MSAIIFRCARCSEIVSQESADPVAEINDRLASGRIYTTHVCKPTWPGKIGAGAVGVATLIGESERPMTEPAT